MKCGAIKMVGIALTGTSGIVEQGVLTATQPGLPAAAALVGGLGRGDVLLARLEDFPERQVQPVARVAQLEDILALEHHRALAVQLESILAA